MLDIKYAVTEPFLNYHLFHENLNTKVKVLTASLNHVIDYLLIPGNEDRMKELIKKADISWQFPPTFLLPIPLIEKTKITPKMSSKEKEVMEEIERNKFLKERKEISQDMLYWYVSEMAIFSSFSALDDCIVDIESWLSSWRDFNKMQYQRLETESNDKIKKLYESYGWDSNGIEKYLPIFNYFLAIRNSIAHRQSKASNKLSELSKSKELKDTVGNYFKHGEPLPEFEYNESIFVPPKTTLLCSHIIRLIFKDINCHIIREIGVEGIVYMSCKVAFDPSSYDEIKTVNLAKNRLNEIVSTRYRVIIRGDDEAVKIAESLGVWHECAKLHANNMRRLDPKF